jgi:hypothetical protein
MGQILYITAHPRDETQDFSKKLAKWRVFSK